MAVQETHLSEEHVAEIERLYRHLKVFNTADPDNPTGAGGVAIVLNKLVTNTQDAVATTLIPGRAIQLVLNWHRGKDLPILAVYAPTIASENSKFWKTLKSKIRKIPGPNRRASILLGDFNFVEDSLDRFPVKKSRIDSPESFQNLKRYLRVQDGWRKSNLTAIDWTWRNADRSSMSRIDRIYVTEELLRASRRWDIVISSITSNDHSRVETEIVNLDTPETGPGRWALNVSILKDRQFLEEVEKLGKVAAAEMKTLEGAQRSGDQNVQTVWRSFKDGIAKSARGRAKAIAHKAQEVLNKHNDERNKASQDLSNASNDAERERA
ncbi:DNase I-like protein, partial [Auricularia subglabra TFB-10046 SS5]